MSREQCEPEFPPAGEPAGHSAAERAASALADDMATRWAKGERPRAEDYLAAHPDLSASPAAAVRLVYEEYCLSQDHGEPADPADLLRRFPQWRDELEVLLDCHKLLEPETRRPEFPAVGSLWHGIRLVAELGGGGGGHVYLAEQPDLAGRPVVLKLAPGGGEHQTLARLQHTNIVPLYGAEVDEDTGLVGFWMPYFGGLTLSSLLEELGDIPPARRHGSDLVAALDRANARSPVHMPAGGAARQAYGQLTYPDAVCLIALRLADALQYAHERGLVHLDVKPGNVLLAADGEPMLLDFHLSREPLRPDQPAPEWMGGTRDYMSPEQTEAIWDVRKGRPAGVSVDARSDVYSLGVVTFEALAGRLPRPGDGAEALRRACPVVPRGLADVIERCLRNEAAQRYPTAEQLAGDLRRHLSHLPLKGVRNRSLIERWSKWRRRRPHALAVITLSGLALSLALAGIVVSRGYLAQRRNEQAAALASAQQLATQGRFAEAVAAAKAGLAGGDGPAAGGLTHRRLRETLEHATHGEARRRLREFLEEAGFAYGAEPAEAGSLRKLLAACDSQWADRGSLGLGDSSPEAGDSADARRDLTELAVLRADLRARAGSPAARAEILADLSEAERLSGASRVLERERRRWGDSAPAVPAVDDPDPRASAWEHYAMGRTELAAGRLEPAAAHFGRALAERPQDFWPNFYVGVCAYRLRRYQEAARDFSACVALRPDRAPCYFNRGLAEAALGEDAHARADYDRALALDPAFAAAALNRAALRARGRDWRGALADLERADQSGADPAAVAFNKGLAYHALGDDGSAVRWLREALRLSPGNSAARAMLGRLTGG